MKVDSPVYKGIDKNLYKEIMLNAAEHYGWDKSSVTDEYISDAYQKTGGDVNKYLRRIFESGGDNPEVVTQDYVVELLDRHGVVDKINTPRTSSFLKLDEASEGVPNKVTDVWVDNFYVPEDKGTKEDIKFSVSGAVDSIDEYYNSIGDLTPVQKEAIANRRFGNAYREVMEKYGNTSQAAKRINEEAGRIINDLGVVYKDGRFVANDADRKAYDMYFTAAMVNPKDYNQVFRRDEDVKSRVDVAKELNDEFERNFYKPSMGITGGEPLRVTPGSEIAVASGLLYESGVNEAPKLFNDATIKLYAELEQAKRDNAVVNFAKGTGKGFWNHFADMVTEMQDFGRNAAATGLNKKIDSIQEELRKERPFEEVPPEVDSYGSLEDYMAALRKYESDQKKYNNEISLAAYQQLTPKEQNLINSAANYYGAVQEVSKEIPNSRNMGKVFGGSLGYMVEFMGTGGSGWIKGAAKAGLSGLAKAAARRGAKSLARGLAGAGERIAVEAGEQVAKNIPQKIAGWVKEKPWQAAEAAVQSVVMPSFYKEVGDRISQGENPTSAFVGSLYDTWTENFSERFFVGGGKVGRLTGSAIDWGKVKGLKGMARLAGNNLEEYGEELVGDFLKRLPEWADKNWTQAYGDYWDDKWDTLVNVSLMTGMLGGAAEISNSGPVSRMRYKWNADIYRKVVPEMLANNIDELIESGDIASQEASETIGNLVEASSRANNIPIGKLTGDVVRYVTARQKQKGFELFTKSAENREKSSNLTGHIQNDNNDLSKSAGNEAENNDAGRGGTVDQGAGREVIERYDIRPEHQEETPDEYRGDRARNPRRAMEAEGQRIVGIAREKSENSQETSDLSGKSVSLQENERENSDEISEQVSQGEHGTLPEEVGRVEEALSELKRRSRENAGDAPEAGGTLSGRQQKEIEARAAEDYAKKKGVWIPMQEVFSLGEPAPSGNENDVYFNSEENTIYKVNNLMNSGSISSLLERIKLHNQYFPNTHYELAGFSGFGGRDVYPVLKQRYIENSTFATPEEIDGYMKNLGFERVGDAKYANNDVIISDLRPRNVLKDADGDFYVVDAEFERRGEKSNDLSDSIKNPIGRSLSTIEAQDLLTRMTNNAEEAPELELTTENWIEEFGKDGMVDTPIGKVKMGENQYFKLAQQGRSSKLGMIRPTLTNPDVIVEDQSKSKNGETERSSSYVFIKSFLNKGGERSYLFTSVTIQKNGKEVVVSNQEKKPERIKRLLEDGKLAYIKEATLPFESGTSTQGDQHTNPAGDSSVNKDINNLEESQGKNNFSSENDLVKRLDLIVNDFIEQNKKEIRENEERKTGLELEEIRWNVSRKGIVVDVDGRRVRVSRTKKGGYNTKNEKAIDAFEQELDRRMENEKPKVNAAMEKRISDYNQVIDDGAKDFRRKLEEGKVARTRTMEAMTPDNSVSLSQAGEIKRKVKEAYNQGKGEVTDKINSVRSALSAYRGLGQLSDKQYKNILKKLSRKNADVEGILDNIDNMIVDNAFRERAYAAKVRQRKQADVIRKKISKMMLPDWLGHDVMERFITLDTDDMNARMLDQYEGMMDNLAKARPKFSRFIPDFIDKYDEIGVEDVAPKKSEIEVDLEGLQDRIKGINSRIGSNGKLSEASVGKVNSQFNEKLDELTEENAERLVLSLGVPNSILRSAGISDKPMKLYGNKVIKKMKKHGFALSELRNLPEAVSDPIAVFDNLGRAGNRSILTELRTKQGNFLVTVDLGKDADVDFNIISSVFGKGDNNIVHWINKGFATYINKEKARSFLSHQSAPIAAAAANEELSSATNIVKNFENPTVLGEESAGIRTIAEYRKVNWEVSRLKNMASRWYEEELGKIEEDSDGYEERVKAVSDSYQRLLDDIEGVQDRLKDVSVNLKKDLIQGIWGKDGSGMLRETMEGAGLEGSPFEEVLQEIKRFGVDLKGFENLEIKDLMNLETALFNASIGVPTRDLFTVWSKLKANEMGKRLVVSREKIERAGENKRVRRLLDNLEKLKDVVDMHDFSMVDAIFDAGSGKDLYENFFVPQIERAVVRMDKEKALALKEFGESMQKLENYFVLSRLSSGTPLKRLMRGDVQRCRDLAGMIMTQLDYESNVSVPFEELPDGLKDYFGNVIGKANVPKDLRKRTKAAYQFMRFGEDGRLDIEKTLEALKDKELAGILKEVMGVARRTLDGSMKQYNIANAVRRGVNIKMMDNYFPRFVRKGLAAKTDGEIDFQHIYASGRLMPTMLPGSMNKRVTKAMPNPVEIDIARVMRRAADETLTDYFLAPAFAQANSALIGVQKDGGKAAGAFEVLREAMKDRLIKNYRREISKDDLSFVKDLDRVVAKMARTLLLAKIPKTVAEFASNQVGSLISDGTAGWSYWGKINVLHELADAMNLTSAKNIVKYNEMYRDATGGKMSLGEKGVNKLITINDEWTSSAIYYKTFNKLFEKYSGQKFDYKKAQTDEKYRRWAIEDHEGERSYFERAYIGALTRAQESFTTVNRALGATHTRFLPGKGKIDVDSFAGRAFGFMMSFNTNERFEFVRGAREFGTGIRTGNKQLIRDGLGRMASRFVRGAVYAGFMQEIGSLIASGFRDDKDPEWSVNPNLLAGTCIQLALGRYGNTGGMLLNFGLGALKWWDKKVNGNTALTKSVVSAINDGAGIYAVPLSTDMPTLRTIEKVFPHWGFMTRIVTDSPEMAYDVYKKLEKGEELSDDEQMLWGSISLMNAVLTMLYPNPVTTTGFNVSRTVEGSYKRDKYEKRDSVGQVLQRKPGQRSQTLVTRGR